MAFEPAEQQYRERLDQVVPATTTSGAAPAFGVYGLLMLSMLASLGVFGGTNSIKWTKSREAPR